MKISQNRADVSLEKLDLEKIQKDFYGGLPSFRSFLKKGIAIFILCFGILNVNGQAQGVGGGLSLAGIASQIDGDQWGGYNKLGLHFGGFAFYDFNEKLSLMTEILYGHRGSREVVKAYSQIAMNYIDVPVMLRYRVLGDDNRYMLAEAGTSANILLSVVNGIKPFKIDVTDLYHRFTMEAHFGATVFLNPNVGIFARWSVGYFNLIKIYPPWFSIHYISLGLKVGFKR